MSCPRNFCDTLIIGSICAVSYFRIRHCSNDNQRFDRVIFNPNPITNERSSFFSDLLVYNLRFNILTLRERLFSYVMTSVFFSYVCHVHTFACYSPNLKFISIFSLLPMSVQISLPASAYSDCLPAFLSPILIRFRHKTGPSE